MIKQSLFFAFLFCLNYSLAAQDTQCCVSETWTNCPVECNNNCCPLNSIKMCGETSRCLVKGQVQNQIKEIEKKISNKSCDFYDEIEKLYECGEQGYPLSFGKKYCQKFLDQKESYENQDWQNSARKCLQQKIFQETQQTYKQMRAFVCENLSNAAYDSLIECYVVPEPSKTQISYCNNSFSDNFKMFLTHFKGGAFSQIYQQAGPIACQCAFSEVNYENIQANYLQNLPICTFYKTYEGSQKYMAEFIIPYYEQMKDFAQQKYGDVKEKTIQQYEKIQNFTVQKIEEAKGKANKRYDEIKEFSIQEIQKFKSFIRYDDVKNFSAQKIEEIKEFTAQKYVQIHNFTTTKLEQAKEIIRYDQFKRLSIRYFEEIKEFTTHKYADIKNITAQKYEVFKDKVGQKYSQIKEITTQKYELVKEYSVKQYGIFKNFANKKYDEGKEFAIRKYEEEKKVVIQKYYEVTDYIDKFYKKCLDYINSKRNIRTGSKNLKQSQGEDKTTKENTSN